MPGVAARLRLRLGLLWRRRGRAGPHGRLLRLLVLDVGEGALHDVEQALGVGAEAVRAELERLPTDHRRDARRQLVAARHQRAVDQDRDEQDLPLQRGLDLEPDEVVGVVQAPRSVRGGDVEPLLADQGEQDVARPDGVGDGLDEVVTELDGVDVLEDLVRPEPLGEAVVEPARRVRRVLPPVADEDPAGRFGR